MKREEPRGKKETSASPRFHFPISGAAVHWVGVEDYM